MEARRLLPPPSLPHATHTASWQPPVVAWPLRRRMELHQGHPQPRSLRRALILGKKTNAGTRSAILARRMKWVDHLFLTSRTNCQGACLVPQVTTALRTVLKSIGVHPKAAAAVESAVDRIQWDGCSPDDLAALIFTAFATQRLEGYEEGLLESQMIMPLGLVHARQHSRSGR